MLEGLSEKYTNQIAIAECNIDMSPRLPAQFGGKSIPSLAFFDNGKMVERITGAVGQAAIEEAIKKILSGEKLVAPLNLV